MSAQGVVHAVSGRLSLRHPQEESLQKLHDALEAVPALRDSQARSPKDLQAMIKAMAALQDAPGRSQASWPPSGGEASMDASGGSRFPSLADFERDFPSLCFALATGVGKTRLMGAFITYLHAAYGYRHFFVLAPNLTIYDKLIRDFTPNTPKYVFKGIAEFATTPPEVITGDNYEQTANLSLFDGVQINIFNISKINSEVRGGKSPRIKRLSEYLGQSYFDYLANLPDLVLLMDESHRYRASAGVRALNELKPLLGLELTATPFVEGAGGKPVPFKNVVMDYPLARAIEDGFVKEPAVVTQQNFNPADHSAEQIERIKLMDGIRVHEETKVHLQTYAAQTGVPPVKPFMLVIARDTTHAAQLLELIQSDLFHGQYKGRVIQVDSSKTGADEEKMIRDLLEVEHYDSPTEIVIHVNMLKEGWDVTNLYTIVPLRAANARTLIEQSIGRGLRLPYGRKTGVEVVDRLNIIAHDKFNEVVEEAGRGDSPIRLKKLELAPPCTAGEKLKSVTVPSTADVMLGLVQTPVAASGATEAQTPTTATPYATGGVATVVFAAEDKPIVQATRAVIAEIARDTSTMPSSAALARPEVQARITQMVQERLLPTQSTLEGMEVRSAASVAEVVQKTAQVLMAQTIDIPRILVKPMGAVKTGYRDFTLDVSHMKYQPMDQKLLSKALQSGEVINYGQAALVTEDRAEDYIVRDLIDYDDVSYDDHADRIYGLAGQAVSHFRSYLPDEEAVHNVLGHFGSDIAKNIYLQMSQHYYEESSGSEVVVSQGFSPLKPCAFTQVGEVMTLQQTPPELSKIAQHVYGGFQRCAYPLQKFHSNTERVLAAILDQQAKRWFRPLAGQFNIYYRSGANQPEYVPDFVAELDDVVLMIETKKAKEVTEAQAAETEVKAKAGQAIIWCQNASDYTAKVGGKPWKYLLIPHDVVAPNVTVQALVARYALAQ